MTRKAEVPFARYALWNPNPIIGTSDISPELTLMRKISLLAARNSIAEDQKVRSELLYLTPRYNIRVTSCFYSASHVPLA